MPPITGIQIDAVPWDPFRTKEIFIGSMLSEWEAESIPRIISFSLEIEICQYQSIQFRDKIEILQYYISSYFSLSKSICGTVGFSEYLVVISFELFKS